MDVLIERLDGQQKRFSELGLIPQDFLVSTAGVREYGSQITGRAGRIDKGADYDVKNIDVPFLFASADLPSYPQKRDEIYAWLGGKEAFYIYEGRGEVFTEFEAPGESYGEWSYTSDVDTSKRYLVRRTNDLAPNQQGLWGLDRISLSTVELPFAESTALRTFTTTVNGPEFIIWNNGTETIDPEQGMELTIEYQGSSNFIKIWEMPDGVQWEHNAPTVAGDTLLVDGVNTTKNGLSAVRNTNLNVMKIRPGRNVFKITGIITGTLKISYREYFR